MHRVDSHFVLRMFQPKGRLSAPVQGVWSASTSSQCLNGIKKWLHSDACSGILFNLKGDIHLGDIRFSPGVIMLPVSKKAQSLTLLPGSQLAGLRLHPGFGYGIFGERYEHPTALALEGKNLTTLHPLFDQLMNIPGHHARIATLYRWLNLAIDFSELVPAALAQALSAMHKNKSPGQLSHDIPLSQRQIERHFQKWLGMTPKHYQRILRVKNTLSFLKHNPHTSLVNLALKSGFTDQAHMTREFTQIANITPRQYSKLSVHTSR